MFMVSSSGNCTAGRQGGFKSTGKSENRSINGAAGTLHPVARFY
jgi:hypothetical protein